MKTIVKTVEELTDEEYSYCYRANLHQQGLDGRMRPMLSWFRIDNKAAIKQDAKTILLWDDKKTGFRRLLGWSLTYQSPWEGPVTFFWVKPHLRNKGYGTELMKEVKKIRPRPKVFPWSEEAGGFFSKFNVEVPKCDEKKLVPKPKVC